jgi:hypothetical protein
VKAAAIVVMAALGIAIGNAPAAHADVSAECWAHIADHPGTTPAGDRRYHLEHPSAGFTPCTEYDAGSNDGNVTSGEHSRRSDDGGRKRYDKPGWHCKWTWRGYKCG